MSALDPILVAYDGSAHAQRAAALARCIAGSTGAHVVLAWAVAPFDLAWEMNPTNYARVTGEGRAMLDAEAARFTTPVTTRLIDGEPGAALVTAADELHAGLVLVGTRGRGRIESLLLGSVTREILSAGTRPTLAVHSRTELKRVVAAVDRSAASIEVARMAHALASACQARLVLATAVNVDRAVVDRPASFGLPAEVWAEAVRIFAERTFAPLREHAPGAQERVLYGEPVAELERLVGLESADLVVAGRRGASGADPDDWFSVAAGLAERGPHGTLVV